MRLLWQMFVQHTQKHLLLSLQKQMAEPMFYMMMMTDQ